MTPRLLRSVDVELAARQSGQVAPASGKAVIWHLTCGKHKSTLAWLGSAGHSRANFLRTARTIADSAAIGDVGTAALDDLYKALVH
jgi:hypothetical protein